MKEMYSVSYWNSHPDLGEDTCNTSFDYYTESEAWMQYFSEIPKYRLGRVISEWRYCELVKIKYIKPRHFVVLEKLALRENALYKESVDSGSWLREQAMQAGMAFGCDGYNEVMGYD